MDYDLTDIPEGYDRGREHGPEFHDLWMNKIESLLDGRRVAEILDLGCGTGRFSERELSDKYHFTLTSPSSFRAVRYLKRFVRIPQRFVQYLKRLDLEWSFRRLSTRPSLQIWRVTLTNSPLEETLCWQD